MKILKKVISFILSAVMLCGIANVSVSADAPMYFDGITTNIFDVTFDGASTAEYPDFAFTKTWSFPGTFAALDTKDGSIKTANAIDLTGAYGYEFTTKTIMTQNSQIIYLAYDETAGTGYKITMNRRYSPAMVTLTRAGSSKNLLEDSVPEDSWVTVKRNGEDYKTPVSTSIGYGAAYTYKAVVSEKTLTFYKGSTEVFSYEDTQAPSLKGTFGVEDSAGENFAVINMKLDKFGEGVTVNDWRYEKKFSSKDTAEGLAADGITTTCSGTTGVLGFSDDYGINYTNTPKKVNFYYDKEFTGDFTAETQVYTDDACAIVIRFNEDSSGKKYYALRFQGNKSTNNIAIVNYDGSKNNNLDAKSYKTANVYVAKYEIKVIDNGESINVTGTVYNKNDTVLGTVTCDIAKTDLYSDKHKMHIETGTAGDFARIYYFNVYSTPSGETKKRDVSVINKEFVTGDTVTSLKNEGINLSTTPTSITDVTHWKSWRGYDGLYWDQYNSSGDEYKAYATTAETVSGDYTFSATTKVFQNFADIIVNSKSTSTDSWTKGAECYYIRAKETGLEIIKKNTAANDTTTLKTIKYKKADGTELTKLSEWSGYAITTTVDVINNVDGSVTIRAKAVQLHTGYTAEDEVPDSTSPYTSGYCRVAFSNGTGEYRNLYDMKLTKHETYTDVGEYEGKFYIDGEEAASYEKGEIYFETPVVDLGTYTVVAALYEDNEMTGLKTFTTRDMCEGKLRLFNTSGSTAKESYVKVYLLDSIETLNKTMSVWTLK